MRSSLTLLTLAGALALAGCGTSGEFRRIDVSADLTSADLAHFHSSAKSRGPDSARIEYSTTGLPWWPFVWRDRESWADPDEQGRHQFHVEDDWGLLLWTVTRNSTANFDHDGRNTGWSSGQGLLLGAIANSSGEAVRDGERVSTSDFRLLWGLFQTQTTAAGSSWRLFWFRSAADGPCRRGGPVSRATDVGLLAREPDIAEGSDLIVRCTRIDMDRKLTVRVVSPNGVPIKDASVAVMCGGRPVVGGMNPQTDAEGRVSFQDLADRDCTVRVYIQSTDFVAPAPVTFRPEGQELELVCRAAVTITGSVVDASGAPKPYGGVRALRDGETVVLAQIGADGRFTLLFPVGDVAPVRIAVDRNNDQVHEATLDDVVPGSREVRLVIDE